MAGIWRLSACRIYDVLPVVTFRVGEIIECVGQSLSLPVYGHVSLDGLHLWHDVLHELLGDHNTVLGRQTHEVVHHQSAVAVVAEQVCDELFVDRCNPILRSGWAAFRFFFFFHLFVLHEFSVTP